jgi:hypothetical protein
MKQIRLKILNKTVDVEKPGQTISSSGSVGGNRTTIYSNLPIRITKARSDGKGVKDEGTAAYSNYLGLIRYYDDSGNKIIILTGYLIIDGDETYKVEFVDDEPGGLIGHHQELYISIFGK